MNQKCVVITIKAQLLRAKNKVEGLLFDQITDAHSRYITLINLLLHVLTKASHKTVSPRSCLLRTDVL